LTGRPATRLPLWKDIPPRSSTNSLTNGPLQNRHPNPSIRNLNSSANKGFFQASETWHQSAFSEIILNFWSYLLKIVCF
jgi:hypothetical protein